MFKRVFKTITVDNGSEFADAEGLQRSIINEGEKRTKVYYCHPYSLSLIHILDAVGRVWEWLDELITRAEHATNADYHASVAWGWDKKSPLNAGEKSYDVGNIYQYYACLLYTSRCV